MNPDKKKGKNKHVFTGNSWVLCVTEAEHSIKQHFANPLWYVTAERKALTHFNALASEWVLCTWYAEPVLLLNPLNWISSVGPAFSSEDVGIALQIGVLMDCESYFLALVLK